MDAIQQWTAGICLSLLAVSLLRQLMPEGAMRRMGELAAGVFLLCAVLIPLTKAAPELSLLLRSAPQSAEEDLAETVERQQEDAVRESLTSLIAAELGRAGISADGITVIVNTGEDGSISITNITVTLPAADAGECDRAGSVLSETLGLHAEVTVNAGG